VKLPDTLQSEDVREQLAKLDLGDTVTDEDVLLHTAHCCTLPLQTNTGHKVPQLNVTLH